MLLQEGWKQKRMRWSLAMNFKTPHLVISMQLKQTIENRPENLAKKSYRTTDQGPSLNPFILSFPADPLTIVKACLSQMLVVKRSIMARDVTIAWNVHRTVSYLGCRFTERIVILFFCEEEVKKLGFFFEMGHQWLVRWMVCTSCWSQMAGSSKNEHLFCPILVGQVWSGCLLVNTYVETYCSLNYNRTAFVPFQLVSFFITILVVANLIILTLLDPVQTGIEKLKNIKPYTNKLCRLVS